MASFLSITAYYKLPGVVKISKQPVQILGNFENFYCHSKLTDH